VEVAGIAISSISAAEKSFCLTCFLNGFGHLYHLMQAYSGGVI